MTEKRGKIAGQECKNLFNSDGLLFPEKKTLQKVITWLRKLNNKSDLFEPRRAPDPFGHLSKWARAEEREDKEERERKRDQNDREERKDRRTGMQEFIQF